MSLEIERLEQELAEAKQRLAEARRKIAKQETQDYEFKSPDSGSARLFELFGGRPDLLVIHNMGKGCTYCTLWADGFNGVVKHLEDRAAFAVASPDPPEVQAEFAASRGWNLRMVSARGTSFFKDMGFENEKRKAQPGVSAFHRDSAGNVFRTGHAGFGPGDDFCATFHLFDLLEGGAGDWGPRLKY
ncbi:MAG: DUF899 family protein [bacterium]